MKVSCIIDSLNSGGAQRQMTWLAKSLVASGHEVQLFTYFDFDHYLNEVENYGVEVCNIACSTKVSRFWRFRHAIRKQNTDVIISFLNAPNVIGLFAGACPRAIPVIVSERNHDIVGPTRATNLRFNAFRLAAKVVTNCYSQHAFACKNYPFLRQKLTTIVNCVDLDKFRPAAERPCSDKLKLVVAASVCERKNAMGLIQACQILESRRVNVSIDWFGNNFFADGKPTPNSRYFLECEQASTDLLPLEMFRFHEPVRDIESVLPAFHGCCLPSFREGCPNVVCESMASGLPVIVSDHGDMKEMVDSQRGFKFNPACPSSIADAIERFNRLSNEQCIAMGRANREYAKQHLSPERFSAEYESLIQEVACL